MMKKSIFLSENQVLCNLLYRLRLNSGLKQSEVAEKIGVPQSFISKIETGQRRIDLIELKKICEVFNISLLEFVKQYEKEINDSKSSFPE
jgi:transcriptional regulator with XRE-family HTH domain